MTPRNLDISFCKFIVLIRIDLFSSSTSSSQKIPNPTNEDANLCPNSREEPSTPIGSYHSPPETPSSVFSHDSCQWNSLPSPTYSFIQNSPSPCPLQSEIHHRSHHRAHSSSVLGHGIHSSWDTSYYSPLNPSSPTISTLHGLEPDMPVPDSNSEHPIPRFRERKTARQDAAFKALKFLSKNKISVTELIGLILDGKGDFLGYRKSLFTENNREQLKDMLTRILTDKKGWELTRNWMLPYAIDIVSEEVHCEMEDAKPSLRMDTKDVTTEFARSWDINQIMGHVAEKITPTWSAILDAATESKESKNKTKTAKSRNRQTVSGYILCIVDQKLTKFLGPLHSSRSGSLFAIFQVM